MNKPREPTGQRPLSTADVAAMIGVCQRRVLALVAKGAIPAWLIGHSHVYRKRDIIAFAKLERRTGRPRSFYALRVEDPPVDEAP